MSPLLSSASVQQLTTLLDLFPVTLLREYWQIKGLKEEICLEIAGKRNIPEIVQFVHDNFSLCKQHIYIFKNQSDLEDALKLAIPGMEIGHESTDDAGVSKTFLINYEVEIVLRNPLDEVKLSYILPVRFDYIDNYVLVRFVVFERDFSSLFPDRNALMPKRNDKEKAFLLTITQAALQAGVNLTTADLHKGVKKLWKSFMDSPKIKYKAARSTDSKSMDENRGLRKHDSEEYEKIKDAPLYSTFFETEATETHPMIGFTVDPSRGFVSFRSYTERKGDSDYVVHEILKNNN